MLSSRNSVKFIGYLTVILHLLFFPLLAGADLTSDLQNEINQKQTQIQELEKQIAEYKKMVQSAQSQGNTLKNEIARMEAQIKKLETEIRLTQTKISEANLKIEGLANDISTRNLELEKQKNNLIKIFQALYEYDQEGPLTIILGSGNFSDVLSQVQYTANLQNGVQEKLTAIRELKTELENQKTESENQKAALEKLKKQLNGQSQVLDSERDERADLLSSTKNQEKQYQTMLTDLQKKREQIEDEIYAAEQKLQTLINQSSITAGKGALLWPINDPLSQNYGCILTSFARRSYPDCSVNKKLGGFHNGIDIDGDTGQPVIAARDGVVSGVGNLGKYSYGKWITITHDNGITTLYGHLSAQSVKTGQKVKSGDIIGYVGSTGYSTGSHLHFTVYATNTFSIQQKWYGPVPLGGSLNPLLYL